MKNKFVLTIYAVFGLIAVSALSSCNKDEVPSTVPSGNAFFNLDGSVFIGVYNSTVDTGSYSGNFSGTYANWWGYEKTLRWYDTTVQIKKESTFKIGKYTVDTSEWIDDPGTVTISARYGNEMMSSSPKTVRVTSGDFEMKRENNRWVAYLTNGKGREIHGNAIIYNNISMKFIYPF
jgi:hypothetical protein